MPKRSIHRIAVTFVLQPCKCQTLVFLVRNKSDTWIRIGVNLIYEWQWGESSRVLSLYGKKL